MFLRTRIVCQDEQGSQAAVSFKYADSASRKFYSHQGFAVHIPVDGDRAEHVLDPEQVDVLGEDAGVPGIGARIGESRIVRIEV
jgi:hypothetical protein